MLSNKLICLIVLCGLICLSLAKPYGAYGQNYGYGFPSMYGGSYGTMPGYHTKPYGTYGTNNIGYGFPNPMGYQGGLMSYGFGNNLNKHKGYMGNSYGGYSPYNRYGNGGLFSFLG